MRLTIRMLLVSKEKLKRLFAASDLLNFIATSEIDNTSSFNAYIYNATCLAIAFMSALFNISFSRWY